MLKRLLDLILSVIALVLLSPVLFAVALAIVLWDGRPVLYRGKRVGRFGRPFYMLKFRTMVVDAERLGSSAVAADDWRITPVGKFLRATKLDELPQLIHVLRGEMSLVGPRPEPWKYLPDFTGEYEAILQLLPGVTDWASIWDFDEGAFLRSCDDPDKAYADLIRPMKLKLQLWYARNHSLLVDIHILLCTAIKLFNRSWVPKSLRDLYPVHPPSFQTGAAALSLPACPQNGKEAGLIKGCFNDYDSPC